MVKVMLLSLRQRIVNPKWLRALSQCRNPSQPGAKDAKGSDSEGYDTPKDTCSAGYAEDSKGGNAPQDTSAIGLNPDSKGSTMLTGAEEKKTSEQRTLQEQAKPPPDWYKRGAWVDPATIERRMWDNEPADALPSKKEPETAVGRSLTALIKVVFGCSFHAAISGRNC